MTREELGHLVALRNLLHGAPASQEYLARRLERVDQIIAENHPRWRHWLDERNRTRPPIAYSAIAGKVLDMLGQRKVDS